MELKDAGQTYPLRLLSWILGLSCPSADRDGLLGDLEEEFRLIAAKKGSGRAQAWFWKQATSSILWLLASRFRLGVAAFAGAAAAVITAIILGEFIELWIDDPQNARAVPFGMIVAIGVCGFMSATAGSCAGLFVLGSRSFGISAFIGIVVIAPELLFTINTPLSWTSALILFSLGAASTGISAGNRLWRVLTQ